MKLAKYIFASLIIALVFVVLMIKTSEPEIKEIEIPVSSFTLNDDNFTKYFGKSHRLKVSNIMPNNTNVNKTEIWTSSNENVATVDQNGRVITISEGTSLITCTIAGVSKTCNVTVKDPTKIVSFDFDKAELFAFVGEPEKLELINVQPSTAKWEGDLKWSSDDELIAKVEDDGTIIPVSLGTTYIRCKVHGKENSCKITVKDKKISFTFDDGPHKSYTNEIMSLFEKYNGKASFFVLGSNTTNYPDVIKDIYQRGHEIGNHSSTHNNLANRSYENIYNDINSVQEKIFNITGEYPKFFRPPYGSIGSNLKAVLKDMNLEMVMWNIDPQDWKFRDSEVVRDNILRDSFDGGVLVMHDIHFTTIHGVEMALEELDKQGYEFVVYSEINNYKD